MYLKILLDIHAGIDEIKMAKSMSIITKKLDYAAEQLKINHLQ